MPDNTTERLPRRTKIIYGAGDTGFSVCGTIIGVLFAIYLTDVVGLKPGLAAAAVFIGRTWGLPVVLGLAALAGIGVGAAHVLPWSIIPDAVEWDELATGQRHEGMFYSLVTLMQKVASSVAIPLSVVNGVQP